MSEVRKKLEEEASKHEYTGRLPSETPLTSMYKVEEIRKKEQEVKEKIKRKKEELRLKKEDLLAKLKSLIIHQIDDEAHAVTTYDAMILMATRLGLAENVRDLTVILSDERRHFSTLNSMRGTWITRKR